MRITHVVENLNRGGLERMVLELVKQQCEAGHQCQVVCVFESGSLASELDGQDVAVVACHKGAGLDIGALLRLRRAIGSHRADILHTHNAVAHYQAVLATMGQRFQRIINTRHGMGENRLSHRREWLYRQVLWRTDAVVLVCHAARRAALARGIVPEEKASVVPNAIPLPEWQEDRAEARSALISLLGVPPATRIVGTVGRLNWAKDQQGLIRAFAPVHRQRPDTALVLVGDGELRAELESLAATEGLAAAVHFLGDRNDVPKLLRGFDLFVLCSVSEGYSMALLEACAAALPIIATDVGGNGEIVRDASTGWLIPARDPQALTDAMQKAMDDMSRSRTIGLAARGWVEANGSLRCMAERYARLYLAGRP